MSIADDILARTSPEAIRRRLTPRILQASRRTSEPETSLEGTPAKGIGSRVLSGLARVGNVLDLPGSMVRDFLAGKNPFDQLLTPTSHENRTTGRELLRKYGAVGSQDTWGNFGGGLAAEIALDPLTYLTFGASALNKGGSLAKKAGIIDHARAAATPLKQPGSFLSRLKTAATKDTGVIGPATFRSKTTLQGAMDLADKTLGQGESLKRLLKVADQSEIDHLLHKPLGGTVSLQVPLVGKGFGPSVGSGQIADAIGHTVRKSAIGRHVSALFDHRVRGATSESGQQMARDFTQREAESLAKARSQIAPILERIGPNVTADQSARMYQYLESRSTGGATRFADLGQDLQHLSPDLDKLGSLLDDVHQMERNVGLDSTELDDVVDYFSRVRQRFAGDSGMGRDSAKFTAYPTGHPHQIKRELRNIGGGTATLQRMSQDARFSGIARQGLDPADVKAARASFFQTYAAELPSAHLPATAGKRAARKADNQLWHFVSRLDPRHVREQVAPFLHNPAEAALRRLEHGYRTVAAAETIRDSLLKVAVPAGTGAGDGTINLAAAIRGWASETKRKLTDEGAANYISKLTNGQQQGAASWLLKNGRPLGANDANELLYGLRVPKDIAADAGRVIKSFTTPEEVGPVIKAIDNFTRMFKMSVTSLFPSFHARNLVSGMYQNMIGGAIDGTALRDAHLLTMGKAIKGAENIRGIAATTTEEATRELAQEMWSHGIQGGSGYVADMAGNFNPAAVRGIPGATAGTSTVGNILPHAGTLKRPGAWVKPTELGTDFRPNKAWAPGVVATDFGNYVEGLNRISGYIALRRKGFSAAAAAEKIRRLHVDYGALSQFERSVMKRAIPFYAFTRGILPFTLEEFLTRPGGRMGATVRAVNAGRSDDSVVPDYIADTASIRLPDPTSTTQRYLTGFGLMAEDPISFLGGGAKGGLLRGLMLEGASRMNPVFKAPLEWMTGQSFFQKTPLGGRPLEDLDPTVGRTIANIRDQLRGTPSDQPTEPVRLDPFTEFVLSNSPASRALTTIRQLTDRRRGPGEKALNTLTGVRTSIVSEANQDAIIRERADELMRSMGAKKFLRTYFPESAMEQMSPLERQQAMELQDLLNRLANRTKARKEARAAGK